MKPRQSKPTLSKPLQKALCYTTFKTPLGQMGIAATPKGVCWITTIIESESAFANILEQTFLRRPEKSPKSLKPYQKELEAYFSGKLKVFSTPLDFILGTEFQKGVWQKLRNVPHGTTRDYSWLARSVGNPAACRAVGNANGKNPIPIIVPCHRIVQKNGTLGGYTGGVHLKEFLLNLEEVDNGPV